MNVESYVLANILVNAKKDYLVEFPLQEKQCKGTYLLPRCIWAKGNLHHNAHPILLEEKVIPSIHIMLTTYL